MLDNTVRNQVIGLLKRHDMHKIFSAGYIDERDWERLCKPDIDYYHNQICKMINFYHTLNSTVRSALIVICFVIGVFRLIGMQKLWHSLSYGNYDIAALEIEKMGDFAKLDNLKNELCAIISSNRDCILF